MKVGRSLSIVLSISIVLVLIIPLILTACQAEPTATEPAATTPAATEPTTIKPTATEPATTTAPAATAEVIEWRFADVFPRGDSYNLRTEAFCKNVETMSDGRIQFTYYASDELVASGEVFDAITQGMIETGHIGMGFATGSVGKVQNIENGAGCFLEPYQLWGMLYDENNEPTEIHRLIQSYYSDVGVWPIPDHFVADGDWVYSTKKFKNGVSDLIGTTMRTSGTTAEILTALGAATVWLAPPEIYTALQTGVVEACEWANPDTMLNEGFGEVAPYWYMPSFWGPFNQNFAVNLDEWNDLPADLQKILTEASKALWLQGQADANKKDGAALVKAQEDYGVEIIYWSEEDMAVFADAWKDVMDGIATSGEPHAAELYALIKEYRESIGEWPE